MIYNKDLINRFDNEIIRPMFETSDSIVFMIYAQARKKYCPELTNKTEINKKLVYHKKDTLLSKVKELDILINHKYSQDINKPIPKSAFVIYIQLHPKCMLKAYNLFKSEVDTMIYNKLVYNNEVSFNSLDKLFLNKLSNPKARYNKKYVVIDIDDKEKINLDSVLEYCDPKWVTETRGGYHVITEPNKELFCWLSTITNLPIEYNANPATIVPGTIQVDLKLRRWNYEKNV